MKNCFTALIVGALAMGSVAPASAQDTKMREKAVSVTNEDFANAKTVAKLERRIASAARSVCARGRAFDPPSRGEEECYDKALENARLRLAEVRERHGLTERFARAD